MVNEWKTHKGAVWMTVENTKLETLWISCIFWVIRIVDYDPTGIDHVVYDWLLRVISQKVYELVAKNLRKLFMLYFLFRW